MDQNVKTKWVAALRSGDYDQGISVLHDPTTDQYCCLGVLCEIAYEEGIIETKIPGLATMTEGHDATLYDGEGEFLPTSVCLWAGLPSTPVITDWAAVPRPLPDLNDVTKLNFIEIADLIERYL